MKKKTEDIIRLSSPHMSGYEIEYVNEAIEENQVFPLGKNVTNFEKVLREYSNVNACACLSSGTSAIHLALILLDVQPNDEVICASFTFAASANPIVYLKARPVFVDSDSLTWNMDPDLLKESIADRIKKTGKKPKAIILVHLYGMPAYTEEIINIATEYDIPVIEDAAEALGSKYNGKKCGSMSKMGVYSFNGNKIITTSGGGALISNERVYCDKATFLATQARDEAPHYQHSVIGYNYRMSNISAGIGLGQMRVLQDRIDKRRYHNMSYRQELKNIESIRFHTEPDKKFYSNYWLTAIVINPALNGGVTREMLRIRLLEKGIETRPLWKPMHIQPVFSECACYVTGVSEKLFKDGLCLPSGSIMDDEDRQYVSRSITEIIM